MNLPKEITNLMEQFEKAGYQIYLVGGPVRDLIMNRPITNWDFTTDATPEEIQKLLPKSFYNNTFGTVAMELSPKQERGDAEESSRPPQTSVVHGASEEDEIPPRQAPERKEPQQIVEITTMRKEGKYEDARHPSELAWTKDIKEDLNRRDFTMNAIAMDKKGEFTDPHNGQAAIQQKLIQAVGDPNLRFSEDALRMLRAIRFASQLEFIIEDKTFQAIKENASKIKQISWERSRDELLKILGSNYPYEGMVMLRNAGLLLHILPEIEKCFGIAQEGPRHDRVYDIGDHSFRSLKFCPSPDPIIRFAALIHDVGKVDTYRVDETGNATFYAHDLVGAKIAEKICQRLRLSKKDTEKIVNLVRYHLFTVDEKQTDSAIRRFIRNVGLDNLEAMFDLREADRLGGSSNPTSWRTEHFKKRIQQVMQKPFSVTDLKVNGKDVMEILQIPPSRKVGEVLDQLFEEVVEDKAKNEREYLLEKLKQLATQ